MKPSKTEYRGGEALRFSTRALELVVTTAVGPRIVSLRSTGGKKKNLFIELPNDGSRLLGYDLRGGHRLWHSPEHPVRTYQTDDSPLEVKSLKNGVALTQPAEEKTGIQKSMTVEFLGERTVKVTHALTNRGLWTVECAPWGITMLDGGGYGVIPLLPKGSHEDGDLVPDYSLVPWSYTDLSLSLWEINRDFLGINVPEVKIPQKLGITNYPGWSAYWNQGTTFVKQAPVIKGANYPDLGSCFEVFTNGTLCEFESLGVLTKLEPGKTVKHVEHWTVIDGLPKPNSAANFAKLQAAVKPWLAKL